MEARLGEFEVPFGYVEEGEKKSALVKLVLCRDCGKKLLKGRENAKGGKVEEREEVDEERGERRRSSGGRREERESEDDRYRPELPPDLSRRRSSPPRRRSASPARRRSASPRR